MERQSTIIPGGAPSRETLLQRARDFAPALLERAQETEKQRRMPQETLARMHELGLMRVLQPSRFGGYEMDFGVMTEIGAELAKGCGSSGWVYSNLASHQWMVGMWPGKAQDEIWGKDPDTTICSAFAFPAGKALRTEGGYRISGRWPFSSGIDNADWIMLAAIVAEDDGGPEEHRVFLAPRSDCEPIDNWHVAGLSGTGSKDVKAEDLFVPEHRTVSPLDWRGGPSPGSEANPAPLYKLPVISIFPYCIAGVALGIAQGAMERYIENTRKRLSTYTGANVAGFANVHIKVAEAGVLIEGAQRIIEHDCREVMRCAREGGVPTIEQKVVYRRNGAYTAVMCQQAVDLLFTISGGGGLFDSNPIQRSFRDIHACSSHIALNWDPNAVTAGKVSLGLPPDSPLL